MEFPRAVVVGDLILDLLARVDDLENIAFGTDTFTDISAVPGGSGANCAAWLARMGVETHLVARAGADVFGDFLVAELEKDGVKPHIARDPELPTGKVFVLVDGVGERTMITSRGAGENLGPEDLPAGLFSARTHLHLSGYTLSGGSRREASLRAMRLARDAGATVSVDPSSVPLLEDIGPERFLSWTRDADLAFPNLPEGRALTGETEPGRVAQALLTTYAAVALKLGPEGALYADRNGRMARVPAEPARVVDTTGAGDAFCAGFLAAWLSGEGREGSLRGGVRLAARAVGSVGGRPG